MDKVARALLEQDRRDALQNALSDLVSMYGLKMVVYALTDEAARQTMEDSNQDAIRVFDVLRATKALVDGDCNE
jgi:hypothetical protein